MNSLSSVCTAAGTEKVYQGSVHCDGRLIESVIRPSSWVGRRASLEERGFYLFI